MINQQGMDTDVDYAKIADSLDFYESIGYKKINVPWTVSREADQITGKGLPEVTSILGNHVASAEQSFLELIINNKLSEGKFVACTPCYRDDNLDEYHNKYFMK